MLTGSRVVTEIVDLEDSFWIGEIEAGKVRLSRLIRYWIIEREPQQLNPTHIEAYRRGSKLICDETIVGTVHTCLR